MLTQPKNIKIDLTNGSDANDGVIAPVQTEARARALAVNPGDTIMGMLPTAIPVGKIMDLYKNMKGA